MRQLLKDEVFVTKMILAEKRAWLDSRNDVELYVGNVKSPEWEKIFSKLVESFKKSKCSTSLKHRFMDS